ncbi:MAG: hypothetical protein K0U74_03195 [Alphaproteobacteria bacterium]|nr:hypothetical protein [Alphaproteobacteria bacterium]
MKTQNLEKIAAYTIEGEAVQMAEIVHATEEMKEWLSLKLTTGAYSSSFLIQLALHYCRVPQPMSGRTVLADIHEIFDQIGGLEGAPLCRPTPTRKAEPFRGGILKGLWKKHWFQASFMPQVLQNENQKNGVELIMKALKARYGRGGLNNRKITEEDIGLMAHASVIGAMEQAANRKKITGEWIVFAKLDGRNIYLGLCGHEDGDEAIFERCKSGVKEFSELKSFPCFSEI